MRKLLAFLFTPSLVWASSSPLRAQDPKPAEQKTATQATLSDTDQPKNEVEQMLADAKKRGEVIMATCVDKCKDEKETPAGFKRGYVVSLAKPAYPPLARAAHAQGKVEVQIIVDTEGKVIAAAAISGHPLLYAAAVQAARNSSFTATYWEGKPVKVVGVVQYNFIPQ